MDKTAPNAATRDNDLSHLMSNLNEESHFIRLDDRNHDLLDPSILSHEGQVDMLITPNNLVTPNHLTDRDQSQKLPNPFEKRSEFCHIQNSQTTSGNWDLMEKQFKEQYSNATKSMNTTFNKYSNSVGASGKPWTEEEKEAFINEVESARSQISFPPNPQLFPASITIQKVNKKKEKVQAVTKTEREKLPEMPQRKKLGA